MTKFFCGYILQNERDERRFYTGLTDDLRKRLANHTAGRIRRTLKWQPWRSKTFVALSDRVRGVGFERYLKSASGHAFVKRHF
jgi:predicted GIY-YIG superfamily endonuclease